MLNKKGFTILETVIVVGIVGFMSLGYILYLNDTIDAYIESSAKYINTYDAIDFENGSINESKLNELTKETVSQIGGSVRKILSEYIDFENCKEINGEIYCAIKGGK